MDSSQAYVKTELTPDMPPPASTVGFIGWMRANLFSSWWNTLLTFIGLYIIYLVLPGLLDFTIFSAVWEGDSREACLGPEVGACWPFIEAKFGQIIYGRYPLEERYRVDIAYFVGLAGLAALVIPGVPYKKWIGLFMLVPYTVMTFYLLVGGVFGMPYVETALWGGLLVTLVVAISGIVASLPIGIVLALGRRSQMPIVRYFCVAFIEFWRGVPLITVLFMSSVLLPLFLPEDVSFDKLLRAVIGVALFASAYMAEVVRGGLQAIPRGQYEGAMALGLNYWKMMGLIVLPQALKMVIPGIVNTFIGLFKDTTLVLIIGLFDLLGIVQLNFTDSNWSTPVTSHTGYLFVAAIFWIFCFGMSRYSIYMENKLHTGHKR
ncbi:MAG: amino acid ABC transporter permease [Rhodovibrionaceae bacterium]